MVSSFLLYDVHITSGPQQTNMQAKHPIFLMLCGCNTVMRKNNTNNHDHNKRSTPPRGSKLPKAPIFALLSSLLLRGLRAPRDAVSHGAPPTTHQHTPMHNHTHTLITSAACKRSITASLAPSRTHMRVRTYNQQATQCTYKGS